MGQRTDAESVVGYCTAVVAGGGIADDGCCFPVDCSSDFLQTEGQRLTVVPLVAIPREWNPREVVAGRQTRVVTEGRKGQDGPRATCRRSHADCQWKKAP